MTRSKRDDRPRIAALRDGVRSAPVSPTPFPAIRWLDARMSGEQHNLTVHLGSDELRIRGVYETVSIVNDIMVALWFVVGSILFFSEATTTVGTWFFLIGSVQLLIRPVIRLS